MNKDVLCYTDLDSIFDIRRCLIQKWIVRGMVDPNIDKMSEEAHTAHFEKLRMEGDRLWEMYIEKDYRNRRMDNFAHPFFQFSRQSFVELYDKRTISDWNYGYYPTKFATQFLKTIMDLEMITEVPVMFRRVILHVNTFPYVFDDEANEALVKSLQLRFGGKVEVKAVYLNPKDFTATYFKQFKHVLKYDILIYPDNKKFMDSLGSVMMTETTFIVPDLLAHENDEFTGEIADRIFAAFGLTSNFFKVATRHHSFYDYA